MIRTTLAALVGLAAPLLADTTVDLEAWRAPALEALDVTDLSLQRLDVRGTAGEPFSVSLRLGDERHVLDLVPHALRAPDYQLLLVDGERRVAIDPGPEVTYRGSVRGVAGSALAGALIDGRLRALVQLDLDAPVFGVQALADSLPGAPDDGYAVTQGDYVPDPSFACGNDDLPPPDPAYATGSTAFADPRECEFVVEADPQYLAQNGGDAVATQNDMAAIMNGVSFVFGSQAGITARITTTLIHLTDPYAGTPGTTGAQLANAMSAFWQFQVNPPQRDLLHLFTGRNMAASSGTIGTAFFNGVCSFALGYGWSQSLWTSNFAVRVMLTAHEVGHNFNAQHCDGQPFPQCSIMCSVLAGCAGGATLGLGGAPLAAINATKSSASCLSQPFIPSFNLTVGGHHSYLFNQAVQDMGLAYGYNFCGQLGNGTTTSYFFPVINWGPPMNQVSAGWNTSLGLGTLNRSVYTWGCPFGPDLPGSMPAAPDTSPQIVPGISGAVSVSAGRDHALVVDAAGQVWAWGHDDHGQLGDGTADAGAGSPQVVAGLPPVIEAVAGDDHSLALAADGTVWAWGRNDCGQLGLGSFDDSAVPQQVLLLTGVTQLAAGSSHSLALDAHGCAWSWGCDDACQLGLGFGFALPEPVPLHDLTAVGAIAAGGDVSAAVRLDGTVHTWGANDHGQLGLGFSGGTVCAPNAVAGLDGITRLDVGPHHMAVGNLDGDVWSWGLNDQGQLGNGSQLDADTPVAVEGLIWERHAVAMAGWQGEAPKFLVAGSLESGSTLTWTLLDARPASTGFLIIGASQIFAPLFCGQLVPTPDVLLPLPTGAGQLDIPVAVPPGLIGGWTLGLQWFVQDPDGPCGYASSDAFTAVFPGT